MSIGGNLKRIRLEKGVSQLQLAKTVGVTQSMIAQIERGTKSLTMELGKEIADTLDISINDLLKDTPA